VRLRAGIIFYGSKSSGRGLERERLVLRTSPYHASGTVNPNQEEISDALGLSKTLGIGFLSALSAALIGRVC
jgi:hypothetical protein